VSLKLIQTFETYIFMEPKLEVTIVKDIPIIVRNSRRAFQNKETIPYEARINHLNALSKMLSETKEAFYDALDKDLAMNEVGKFNEVVELQRIIDEAKESTMSWMQSSNVSVPLLQFPSSGIIKPDPYGVVLIIGAWNYPLSVMLKPMIGAIAAGNAVILKPSEISFNTSNVFQRNFKKYFQGDAFNVVCGGPTETTELLKERFDKICYTGSTKIGKVIMEAASKWMTPVLLECGGKSPCFVDSSCSLDVTVKRICWGKFLNSGQTCVAPDYILVHKDIQTDFLNKLKATIKEFYPEGEKSKDFGKIVSVGHVRRLKSYVTELEGNSKVVVMGSCGDEGFNEQERTVNPLILLNPPLTSAVMQNEIFGPILPVLTVDDVDSAIKFVQQTGEKPLAAYMFSNDKANVEKFIQMLHSGGMAINETVMQVICDNLPFGGCGSSGVGAYNGKHSFDSFSHKKGILWKSTMVDPAFRYPPYNPGKISTLVWLQTLKIGNWLKPASWLFFGITAFLLSFFIYHKYGALFTKK